MYTQCPECESSFRVTAEVLKQAAGMVRCGSCGNAFNSLDYLSEQKPSAPQPESSIPELKPEPAENPADGPAAPPAPKTISAEQSAALLKTLDQLAGEDIRIEDTGVEWRVLGADEEEADEAESTFDPAQTDVSHLDADTEIDFDDSPGSEDVAIDHDSTGVWIVGQSENVDSDDADAMSDPTETLVDETAVFDDQATHIDELLDEAPTPVDELLEAGGNDIENAELFQTQMMGATSPDENADLFQTQMMGATTADENAEIFEASTAGAILSDENTEVFDAAPDEMRFDDNTPLPDDFLLEPAHPASAGSEKTVQQEPPPLAVDPQSQLDLSEPDEWEQLLDEFDDLLTSDLDTGSALNGTGEATGETGVTVDASIEDDLISAAFENEENEPQSVQDASIEDRSIEDSSIDDDLMAAAFDEEAVDMPEPAEADQESAGALAQQADSGTAENGEDSTEAEANGDLDAEADLAADQPAHDELSDELEHAVTESAPDDADLDVDDPGDAGSELGDVLDEASRLAESLDDESGRFQLDDEADRDTGANDEPDADQGLEPDVESASGDSERRGDEFTGDQSIAEELRILEESGQFASEQAAQSDDAAEDEPVLEAEENGEPELERSETDEADVEEADIVAHDDQTDADSRDSVDDVSETNGEDAEELAASAADGASDPAEELDLERVLSPDDAGLVDEGESDREASEEDLPELHDVGDRPARDHDVPPMTDEEETINMLIDQDLLAIAQVDDDGFASTIIVEEGVAPVKVESVVIGDPEEDDAASGQVLDDEAAAVHEKSGLFGLTGVHSIGSKDEPGRGRTVGILAALLLLAVALGGQFIHQNRESLATNPGIGAALNTVYEALGQPITPDWNVGGWDIARTQGATDEQDQLLTIFSEIRNTSDAALPYPVVTLALTDRYQDSIGALILEPSDYLAGDSNTAELVPPGGKFEAVIPIDEPSPEAVGYTINACYRTQGRDLRCAVSDFK